MITFSSKYRSEQEEIMDSMEFGGEEMRSLLDDLRRVNKWLGGNSGTVSGIEKQIGFSGIQGKVRILDLGCGDGEMLRVCSDKFKSSSNSFEFIGVDSNPNIIEEAKLRSKDYSNIQYKIADVFSVEMDKLEYDIALCSLFLHHLKNREISELLEKISGRAKLGVVINDLERSRLSFVLYKFVSTLLVRTRTARIDGLISIASGFKRKELKTFSEQIKAKHSIRWWWAFRYLWVIRKV